MANEREERRPQRRWTPGRATLVALVVTAVAFVGVMLLRPRPPAAPVALPKPPVEAAAPAVPAAPTEPPPPFVAVPLIGDVTGHTAEMMRDALAVARRRRAEVVVLVIDTRGGSGPATDLVARLIDKHPEFHFYGYVDGQQQGGAWSAGAVLALQCEKVAVRRGRGLGAAVPIFTDEQGETQVSEEGFTYLTEDFQKAADRTGFPPALLLALVNAEEPLWAVETADGWQFGPGPRPDADLIKPPGRVLALTADECERYGLAWAVDDSRDAARRFGLGDVDLMAHESYNTLLEIARPQWEYIQSLEGMLALHRGLEHHTNAAQAALDEVSLVPPELASPAQARAALDRAERHAQSAFELADEMDQAGRADRRLGWIAGAAGRWRATAQRLLEGARVARENLTEAGAAQPEAAPVGPPAGSDLPSVPPAFLESTRGLTLVYPMIGVIGHDAVESFRAALDEAATRKARAVVMVVDSPTGAPWTACEIGRLIGDHPDLRFSAYVDGDGALDAASPIPLCCDEILMARGARIRAEEPTLGPTRAGPALEKGLAVLKASWRAYAERRGRSGILADALIDHSFAVWEVPQGSARVFLRGTDDDRPAHGRLLRRQGEPLSLDAEACTRLGLGRSVASAAEASVLLGFREDFTRNAAYDAALRFARERSSVYSARLAWAQRSIAEVQAAADQLLAEVPDDTAPGQAVERLRHSVAAAGNALTLVDELVEQKRQEALPGVDIEPAAQAVEELHNWLQGVRDAYEQIAPAANAAPAM